MVYILTAAELYHATSEQLDPNCLACRHRRSEHPTAEAWEQYFADPSKQAYGEPDEEECELCSCTFHENPTLPFDPMPKTKKEYLTVTSPITSSDPMADLTSFVEAAVKNAITKQQQAVVANTTVPAATTLAAAQQTTALPVAGGVLVIPDRKNRTKDDWKALKEWARAQSGYDSTSVIWGRKLVDIIPIIEAQLGDIEDAFSNGDGQMFTDNLNNAHEILVALKKREEYHRYMAQ